SRRDGVLAFTPISRATSFTPRPCGCAASTSITATARATDPTGRGPRLGVGSTIGQPFSRARRRRRGGATFCLLTGGGHLTKRDAGPPRLDLLVLGEQVLGHPDRGGVDQPTIQRDGAAPLGGRVLHRGDDPVRAVDQPRVGREHVVRELDL